MPKIDDEIAICNFKSTKPTSAELGDRMTLAKWCAWAQDDQNTHHANHLYANYRHSRQEGLIPESAVDDFTNFISQALQQREGDDPKPGASDEALQSAIQLMLGAELPPSADIRFAGPPVSVPPERLMIRLQMASVPLSATGTSPATSASVFKIPARQRKSIRWLTTISGVEGHLAEACRIRGTPFNAEEFFSEIVQTLGLRVWPETDMVECTLQLLRVSPLGTLHRPHAWSEGYAERFCGASPHGDGFGSTADNRSGEAGLPEAVCAGEHLEALKIDAPEYQNFRDKISKFTSWIPESTQINIAAIVSRSSLIPSNLPRYADIQTKIVQRLGGAMENCDGKIGCRCPSSGLRE